MATQFFFTICFVGMLVAMAMVMMYLLCIDDYYRVKVLRWIGFDLMVGGEFNSNIKSYRIDFTGTHFQPPAERSP